MLVGWKIEDGIKIDSTAEWMWKMKTQIKLSCPMCGRAIADIDMRVKTFDCDACGEKGLNNVYYLTDYRNSEVKDIHINIIDEIGELKSEIKQLPVKTVEHIEQNENQLSRKKKKLIERIIIAIIASIIVQFIIRNGVLQEVTYRICNLFY